MKEQTKSKVKNPLYVVKGKDVQEAKHLLDLVLKKFNLEPVVEFIQNMLKMILENIKSYPTFVAMKNLLDELMLKIFGLVSKLGLA
jgi:hypothetical protein